MTYHKAYWGAYLAVLFPSIANLYEKLSGKKIPYRDNALIFAKFPERENHLKGARFLIKNNDLESKTEIVN